MPEIGIATRMPDGNLWKECGYGLMAWRIGESHAPRGVKSRSADQNCGREL
jgi:hypothetical protein